jgi:hypothetical protein
MASVFNHLAPPGRVRAPGALTCVWTFDGSGRLVGRWSAAPETPRAPVARAA